MSTTRLVKNDFLALILQWALYSFRPLFLVLGNEIHEATPEHVSETAMLMKNRRKLININ